MEGGENNEGIGKQAIEVKKPLGKRVGEYIYDKLHSEVSRLHERLPWIGELKLPQKALEWIGEL